MKKVFLALAVAAMVFAGCSKDDDGTIDNLAEKLQGKWIVDTGFNGQPELTNNKEVITFVSSTKAYVSRSRGEMSGDSIHNPNPPAPPDSNSMPGASGWDNYEECDVTIEGNTVTLTSYRPDGANMSTKYQIKSISESEFTCEIVRDAPGGIMPPPDSAENNIEGQGQRYVRITADYKQAILGKWEGHVTSEQGSEFDNGEDHQWEYLSDGTFRYYMKDGNGNWVTNPNQTLSEYFVDGTLLCTRWVIDGTENREWWEIESIADGVMNWTALRQREDGTTYTATFQMVKVPANK